MKDIETVSIQRKKIEKIYGQISPFELKIKLIQLASGQRKKSTKILLDAGRGNPNWIAATPREAFFTFGQFAVKESRRVWNEGDLAGVPGKEGIAKKEYLPALLLKTRKIPSFFEQNYSTRFAGKANGLCSDA